MAEEVQTNENDTKPKPKFTPDTVDEDIPHPYMELYRHTLLRGANTGSLLAILLAPPIMYFRGTRKPRELMYGTGKAAAYGTVIGVGLLGLGTWMKLRDQTEEQVFDRSYRLRYNKGQCHLDFVTYGTVGSGAVAGALTAPAMRGTGALFGGALGFGLAVLVHQITKGKD